MISVERMPVGTRLVVAGVAILLGMLLIAVYTLVQIRSDALAAHSERIRDLVETSRGMVGNYLKLEREHKLSRADAQHQAEEALRGLRFGANDYFFIYDFDGRALMVAGNQQIEGEIMLGKTDKRGFKLWDAFVEIGKGPGRGYVEYWFPRAGQQEPLPKLAYLAAIPEWQWIVGTGVYVDDVDHAVMRAGLRYGALFLLVLVLVSAVAYFVSRRIVTHLGGEVRDAEGKIHHYLALFSDLSALKAHQTQLEHMAHFDALTELPNRVLLADRLHQAMIQAERRGQRLAVAYLDLDGFKAINDVHGHTLGDQLLIALASRMKQTLREGDTLARMGGDEFVAVFPDLRDAEESLPMLGRLLSAAAQPVPMAGRMLQVSASLGVSFYPQAEPVDADQLMRQADQAMYQAKLAGKNRYHIFDAEHDRHLRGHHESVEHVRSALQAREFVLHYQPKVNMRSGRVIGAEALIRWQHPVRGLLAPAHFLPLIENHPLAVELGEWVITTALEQVTRWRKAGLDIPVSVNVGARQLQDENFVPRLRQILAAHPAVRPGGLEIEILETSALEDLARVSRIIEECGVLGVSFALDDFGTGYSSLTYLKRLPVSQLKIDQSFVHSILEESDDLAILQGVLSLAVAFRRQVIAEGVETVEHGTKLLQLGCELAQGYGIARPMPAAELPAWINHWQPDPAWGSQIVGRGENLPLLFTPV
jgi:diguanylate cyclase (GGDEF)-like protein